jgi:hypothetical protein
MSDQTKEQENTAAQLAALQDVNKKIRESLNEIVKMTAPANEDDDRDDPPCTPAAIATIHNLAVSASRFVVEPLRPPVAWALHYRLQASFAKVADALKVPIRQGEEFEPIAARCVERAKAGEKNADQSDAALALVDGAMDAINWVGRSSKYGDLARAKANLERALPILRELAGKGGAK